MTQNTKQMFLGLTQDEHVYSLLDILEPTVDPAYLITAKSLRRNIEVGGVKILSRCACPGQVDLTLKDLDHASFTIRKLTPLECERAMGIPDNWTQIDGESLVNL